MTGAQLPGEARLFQRRFKNQLAMAGRNGLSTGIVSGHLKEISGHQEFIFKEPIY